MAPSVRLTQLCVPHYLVVEPQELEVYKKNFENEYATVIPMDLNYKENYDTFNDMGNTQSTGPGAVRNFCIDLARDQGFKYCHIWDDNIDGTNMWFRGHRLLNRSGGEMFRALEEFVERYDNVPLAGFNYASFCKNMDKVPPYTLNRRIYSMIMIDVTKGYYFRGRYNEDTDLSLRVLKDGYCTVQFNLFLGEKLTTQRVGGGNTEEFYSRDELKTKPKTDMLYEMHPDVTKVVQKFGRYHHQVNYERFTQKLHRVDNYDELINAKDKEKDSEIKIVKVPREIKNVLSEDNSVSLYDKYYHNKECRIDNTTIYL